LSGQQQQQQQQEGQHQLPPTPTARRRICKLGRKRRAHTMPDIMMAPRARTISEQSEEYDKVSRCFPFHLIGVFYFRKVLNHFFSKVGFPFILCLVIVLV
jgi:hypothetical protein